MPARRSSLLFSGWVLCSFGVATLMISVGQGAEKPKSKPSQNQARSAHREKPTRSSERISQAFLTRHPLAKALSRKVRPDRETMTLEQLARFVEDEAGVSVIFDHSALNEEGMELTNPVELSGLEELSLRNLLFYALEEVGGVELAALENEHFLKITTKVRADEHFETYLYPVADLLRVDVQPTPESLSNPYADIDAAFEQRWEAARTRPVTVAFQANKLVDVAAWLREETGLNVRVATFELEIEGLSADADIEPLAFENVPIHVVLREVLQDVDGVPLTVIPQREVILLTTQQHAEICETTRCYSGDGVVYEMPQELQTQAMKPNWAFDLWRSPEILYGFADECFGTDDQIDVAEKPSESIEEEDVEEVHAAVDHTKNETANEDAIFEQLKALVAGSNSVIRLLLNQTDGPWFDVDGEGGNIEFYEPAMAFVVRQTAEVHREVATQLQTIRQAPLAGAAARPARLPQLNGETIAGWNLRPLMVVLQNTTAGPWFDADGEGGTMVPHQPTLTISIRQTQAMHEEIDNILTSLRRMKMQYQAAQGEAADPQKSSPE